MSAAKLDSEIQKVCPIFGVSIGRKEDKATWRIDYKPEATQEQRDAAVSVMESYVWDDKPIKNETEMRIANIEKALQLSSISIPTMTE